jgi:D-alanyl-D-alanine carboxypeptidase/D-alanyl-D-alanine-endopeptidase (penicillin-binding protein 4)
VLSLLCLVGCNHHTYQSQHDLLISKVEQLLRETVPESVNVGIVVTDLSNVNQPLYQKEPNKLFLPASTLKLFTAYAALTNLGPTFTYKTALTSDIEPLENTLNGDLVITFGGDPTLKFTDVEQLISEASNKIKLITGDVIIDDYYFDQEYLGQGWTQEDKAECYRAPISAVIINENCFNLKQSTPIFAKLNFVQGSGGCDLKITAQPDNVYYLADCFLKEAATKPIAYQEPRLYAKSIILYLLNKYDIKLQGVVKFEERGASRYHFSLHESPMLKELITLQLKNSSNLIAETLLKTLSREKYHQPGSFAQGVSIIKAKLAEAKFDTSRLNIVDGSGLSRYNLISPAQLAALLNKIYFELSVSPELIYALPTAGIDGTLKARLVNYLGKVRAKTGSMGGVSTLAGYLQTKSNKMLSFVIMLNGITEPVQKYRDFQDKLCLLLAEW